MYSIPTLKSPNHIQEYASSINKMMDGLIQDLQSAKQQSVKTEETAKKYLNPCAIGGAWDIVTSLHLLQNQYPDIFEQNGFRKIATQICTICTEYGAQIPIFKNPKTEKDYKIYRPVEEFHGTQLIIGCGRATNKYVKQCDGHDVKEAYLVDGSEDAEPDMKADYYSTDFWKEFKDETFQEVYIEGFSPDPSVTSLKEIARILKTGGKARIGLNTNYKTKNLDYFKACGFSKFEVVTEKLFTIGRIGDWEMLHLYK